MTKFTVFADPRMRVLQWRREVGKGERGNRKRILAGGHRERAKSTPEGGEGGSPFRVGSRGHRPLVPLLHTIRREGPEAVGSLYLDSFTFLQQDSGVNLGHRKDVSDIWEEGLSLRQSQVW